MESRKERRMTIVDGLMIVLLCGILTLGFYGVIIFLVNIMLDIFWR